MKKFLSLIALLPALVSTAPISAHAHNTTEKPHCTEGKQYGKKGAYSHKIMQEMQLTQTQKTEIKALRKAFWQENRDQMKSRWQVRKDMARLSYATSVDQAKLASLIESSTTSYAALMRQKAALNNSIFNVLTAEQQQHFTQKMAENQQQRHTEKN